MTAVTEHFPTMILTLVWLHVYGRVSMLAEKQEGCLVFVYPSLLHLHISIAEFGLFSDNDTRKLLDFKCWSFI